MEFLKELHEARMTKDAKNQVTLSFNDCCERLYLILLTIDVMRYFGAVTPFVRKYCRDTMHSDYRHFKIGGTDAYNLIYFILGDEHALDKLKDSFYAKRTQNQITMPTREVVSYLRSLANGATPTNVAQMFIRVENGLNIDNSDYRNLRRNLVQFAKLSSRDKKIIITKLLFALRAKCRNSDIIDDFSKLVAQQDLENSRVIDTEPTISKPDVRSTTSRELMYYKLLADTDNILLIKSFLEHARAGRSIPSTMVKAYLPIIEMIDEIVASGPTYINLLKSIQKRAKR